MNEYEEKGCGECKHCDQINNGTHRYCDIKKERVYALDKPCANFFDIWSKDLFGRFEYQNMKERGEAI